MSDRRRIGVVLGAGSARGWSHIGALEALREMEVPIDVVCGCSSGALVAASYATGRLPALKELAGGMTRAGMLRFLDLSFGGGGLIEGRGIVDFVRRNIGDVAIEDAVPRFGAVATEYGTGREVWFTHGSMIDAVRASIALPGLLTPVMLRGRWHLDGALVNPLPITLARSLGAEVILAVNTAGELVPGRPSVMKTGVEPDARAGPPEEARSSWLGRLAGAGPPAGLDGADGQTAPPGLRRPTYAEILGDSLFTMQTFVTRIRVATDPPDLVVTPDLADIGVMDFHRGTDAMARGAEAVREARGPIRALMG
jgi:NTE family protein